MPGAQTWHVEQRLKRDVFGRISLVICGKDRAVCREARGSWIPGSRIVARHLLRRERRALRQLEHVSGVPHLRDDLREGAFDEAFHRSGSILLRSWIPGTPLQDTTRLPLDFFDHLDRLLMSMHAAGICHNDLHKEQNLLLGEDGFPYLVDFQLSSMHGRDSRSFRSRCREDLRHAQKHRQRYLRHMEARPGGRTGDPSETGAEAPIPRSWQARLWKRLVKPLYNATMRRMLRWSEDEERRPREGPWPIWTAPSGNREEASLPESRQDRRR